jgi:hypothetical protein
MHQQYFLQMIRQLREAEEVMLYANVLRPSEDEQLAVIAWLHTEYELELVGYPHTPPAFDAAAACWAATTVYVAAQLILYREQKESDLSALFPEFEGNMNAAAILSADLCLRFLPDMLHQLKVIDSQDALIEVLEKLTEQWHYSGMRCDLLPENLDFEHIVSDPCVLQLYANRIIDYRKLKLSLHPACREAVKSSLGMYGEALWNEFKLVTTYE